MRAIRSHYARQTARHAGRPFPRHGEHMHVVNWHYDQRTHRVCHDLDICLVKEAHLARRSDSAMPDKYVVHYLTYSFELHRGKPRLVQEGRPARSEYTHWRGAANALGWIYHPEHGAWDLEMSSVHAFPELLRVLRTRALAHGSQQDETMGWASPSTGSDLLGLALSEMPVWKAVMVREVYRNIAQSRPLTHIEGRILETLNKRHRRNLGVLGSADDELRRELEDWARGLSYAGRTR